jgi:hypothetical protein
VNNVKTKVVHKSEHLAESRKLPYTVEVNGAEHQGHNCGVRPPFAHLSSRGFVRSYACCLVSLTSWRQFHVARRYLTIYLTIALSLIAFVAALVTATAPAQAEAYRYWTMWTAAPGATQWTFAMKAPDALIPADGSVDGWRYEVAGADATTSRDPRINPEFATICGSTPAAPSGSKRVALVIDYGIASESPAGSTPPAPTVHCVVAPTNANSLQVLAKLDAERLESGLLCAIDGYPAKGCADTLASATAPPTAEPTIADPAAAVEAAPASAPASTPTSSEGNSFPWAALIAALAVVALLFAAFARSRARRT